MNNAVYSVTNDCNLQCQYCQPAGSPILMADFTIKPIEDLRVGDKIMSVEEFTEKGKHRKFNPTTVTAISQRVAPVIHKLTFEDDSILYLTDDHPVLCSRSIGWRAVKYIRGAYSTLRGIPNTIINTSNTDIYNKDYIDGYFIAAMWGDGSYKTYIYEYGEQLQQHFRTRFAVKDEEMMKRMEEYFKILNLPYNLRKFKISEKDNLEIDAIFSSTEQVYNYLVVAQEKAITSTHSIDFYRGFLAGAYDAEGHIDTVGNFIRISNSDLDFIQICMKGLELLNIPFTFDKDKPSKNCTIKIIRILSSDNKIKKNIHKNLQFLFEVKPAITRKGIQNFYNTSLGTRREVIKNERVQASTIVYSIETEAHTYISPPIIVHNCFSHNDKRRSTFEIADAVCQFLLSSCSPAAPAT